MQIKRALDSFVWIIRPNETTETPSKFNARVSKVYHSSLSPMALGERVRPAPFDAQHVTGVRGNKTVDEISGNAKLGDPPSPRSSPRGERKFLWKIIV